MNAFENIEFPIQGNFPASKEGSTVEYRVLEIGIVGEPVEVIPYTTSGVIDVGKGGFETTLTLSQGFYSVEWHIQGTSLYANEEIDVRRDVYALLDNITSLVNVYSGYAT